MFITISATAWMLSWYYNFILYMLKETFKDNFKKSPNFHANKNKRKYESDWSRHFLNCFTFKGRYSRISSSLESSFSGFFCTLSSVSLRVSDVLFLKRVFRHLICIFLPVSDMDSACTGSDHCISTATWLIVIVRCITGLYVSDC